MKKLKNGLYVGKFIAYHKGHQNCINKFSKLCDNLNLVLCGNTKTDKVDYTIRQKWIEKDIRSGLSSTNNIKFHTLIEDNITPYPEGISQWCSEIKNLLGRNDHSNSKIDVMFGNEDYVRECAAEFGSHYYIPDKSRTNLNISSTKIIRNGLKYYDFLADVSKPYFNKTVLITGAESTGKSNLARKLSAYFNGEYMHEYGRKYEELTIQRFKKNCTMWSVDDYNYVAERHDIEIKSLLEKPIRLLFVDTDAMITEIYCELYLNKNSHVIDEIIQRQKFDLILYLDEKNTTWIADGLRFLENKRDIVSNMILNKMKYYKRDYIMLSNEDGYEKRFEKAKNIIIDTFNLK